MKKRGFGFKDAFCGICHAVLCERNFRVHIVAVLTVVYFGWVFGITKTQWAVLALVMGAVPAAELVNTAIEAMVDGVCPQKCAQARIAKDCAAGAVFVLAVFAVIIAGIVFSDRDGWGRVWEYIKEKYIYLIVFAILSVIFIFGKTKEKNK